MRIRYNLGRGDNYKKWKIDYLNSAGKKVHIHLNEDVGLTLEKPVLINKRSYADKIYAGANKRVCAWIECKDIKIGAVTKAHHELVAVIYNPRIKPYWHTENGLNLDGKSLQRIIIKDKKLYIVLNT
tara:strand:+ start:1167 stop:1547 length:381 start_codon:yes stop_codon:yes gene_type:complete